MSEVDQENVAADPVSMIAQTVEIVSAFLSNNHVRPEELPSLIYSVKNALNSNFGAGAAQQAETVALAAPAEVVEPKVQNLVPAVPIKKSVTADFIICLEDGKHFKSLKRHLRTAYNLSTEQYRAKWGLPVDYPMVAPNYTATRSELARSLGLGRRKAETQPQPQYLPVTETKVRAKRK